MLQHLATGLGVRMRDPAYTLEHVQIAGGLFVQSLALRNVQVKTALSGRDDGDAANGHSAPAYNAPGDNAPGADRDGDGPARDTDADADLTEPAFVNELLNKAIPGPGLHGEPASWTLVSLAYLGLIDAFMELDPDFVPQSG